MNVYSPGHPRTLRFRPIQFLVTQAAVVIFVAGWSVLSHAQTLLPAATPTNTVVPVPVDTPTPAPTTAPTAAPLPTDTLVAEPNGLTNLGAYRAARRPTASVAIAFPGSGVSGVPTQDAATLVKPTSVAAQTAIVTATTLQPQTLQGVFSAVNLGYLNGTNPPPSAVVTLQFDPARSGSLVWIQALDGGDLQSQDASGSAVDMAGGGWIGINALGQITFSYQVPTASARYQVLIRLDNVSSVLPFVVPDPTAN